MKRVEQKISDTWDLKKIFKTKDDFYASLDKCIEIADKIALSQGNLSDDDVLLESLMLDDKLGILIEKCQSYAFMKTSEDGANQESQKLLSDAINYTSKISEKLSFFTPELLSSSSERFDSLMDNKKFSNYKVMLMRLRRQKEHILDFEGEKIMALHSASSGIFSQSFDDLTDVDMKFGKVDGKELTPSTFTLFLHNNNRNIRRKAYFKYYTKFDDNKHLLSRLYEGNVKETIFKSRVRNYKSVLQSKLYADNIDKSLYLNLIKAAHKGFNLLHEFYEIKRKKLNLKTLSHYDVYTSIVPEFKKTTSYDEAAKIVREAVSPLGKEYQDIIYSGITSLRWVDRYENIGKSSGAYSNGGFETMPYIMMNYKEDSYRDIFTLAHEAGHSMHSYYSAKNNPFSCYNYSIFEAETASTFNERLLTHYLFDNSKSEEERLYLLTQEADDIVATFFRQTMFAEYEYEVFNRAESGEAITCEVLLDIYKKLLKQYFGKKVKLFKKSSLEALRIPHFYRPFYVYKYATGITAAIILSQKVLTGGEKEKNNYLNFLKSGGSLFPLENLKNAGADLSDEGSYDILLSRFEKILEKLA